MNSYQIVRHIERFLNSIQNPGYLKETLKSFDKYYPALMKESNSNLNEGVEFTRKINREIFFVEVENVTKILDELQNELKLPVADISAPNQAYIFHNSPFLELSNLIKDFSKRYDLYLQRYKESELEYLLKLAHTLSVMITLSISWAYTIKGNLLMSSHLQKGERQLQLIFFSVRDLKDISLKISILSEFYADLCRDLGISEDDYPLKIVKLESGSLLSILIGNTEVLNRMAKWIEEVFSFVYRNCTKEGILTYEMPVIEQRIKEFLVNTEQFKKAGFIPPKKKIEDIYTSYSDKLANLIVDKNRMEKMEVDGRVLDSHQDGTMQSSTDESGYYRVLRKISMRIKSKAVAYALGLATGIFLSIASIIVFQLWPR